MRNQIIEQIEIENTQERIFELRQDIITSSDFITSMIVQSEPEDTDTVQTVANTIDRLSHMVKTLKIEMANLEELKR